MIIYLKALISQHIELHVEPSTSIILMHVLGTIFTKVCETLIIN